jgi:anti-sigma factor RsiW
MTGFACIDRAPGRVLGWLDGTLPGDTRAELETHLATCERCRRLVANQEVARQAVRSLPMPVVSPDFAARARQRAAGPLAWLDLANWKAWTLGLMPAAAAALLALGLWLPQQRDASSSMAAVLDYWGRGATSDQEMQMILDPDADAGAVLDSALAAPSR